MNEPETDKPVDQLAVNKVIRIINGKPLRYTVHLLMKDGTERQIQTDKPPKCDWNSEARALLLVTTIAGDDYTPVPICRFDDIDIIQCEKNPE